MHPNAQLIESFYSAFQQLNAASMNVCYDQDIVFSDPVFTQLQGRQVTAMWEMLCARASNFALSFADVRADDVAGSAHWEARYTFSQTGRTVHNIIDATFVFRDGRIVQHYDSFNLWRWSAMALGAKGVLLGWLPPVQAAIRRQAMGGLNAYLQKHG